MALSDTFNNAINWVKETWSSFELENISEKIGGSSSEAVQAAVYFGGAFAIGFLFKKYFKFIFGCLLVSLLLMKALEYNALLSIDWEGIRIFMGFQPGFDFNVLVNNSLEWVRQHILLFVASIVGFLIGYKLG